MNWFKAWRLRRHNRRHCPHHRLGTIHGDAALYLGFRLQCADCMTFLNGPVNLAHIRNVAEDQFIHGKQSP